MLGDPTITDSGDPTKAPSNKALNTNLTQFEWLELPENAYRLRRFGLAMRGVNDMSKTAVIQGWLSALQQVYSGIDASSGRL